MHLQDVRFLSTTILRERLEQVRFLHRHDQLLGYRGRQLGDVRGGESDRFARAASLQNFQDPSCVPNLQGCKGVAGHHCDAGKLSAGVVEPLFHARARVLHLRSAGDHAVRRHLHRWGSGQARVEGCAMPVHRPRSHVPHARALQGHRNRAALPLPSCNGRCVGRDARRLPDVARQPRAAGLCVGIVHGPDGNGAARRVAAVCEPL
mmetsp:Transcript_18964/g.45574  ORF Transcript_18964/g.45574 Transcript_18964/m.45574 type:complete len:206 (+) Transcript_18964:2659-3276(+)